MCMNPWINLGSWVDGDESDGMEHFGEDGRSYRLSVGKVGIDVAFGK